MLESPGRNTPERLLEGAAALPGTDLEALRVKALIGPAINKSDFLTILNASKIRGPDGLSWSHKTLVPVLDRLQRKGLLDADFVCPAPLWHPLSVALMATAEGPKVGAAMRSMFEDPIVRPYYGYSLQTDRSALRRLRLSIYENDAGGFRRLIEEYERTWRRELGAHVLDAWFADATVDPAWLASRDLAIQLALFQIRLGRLLGTGEATPDMPALIAHYRDREEDPAYAPLKWALLRLDILTGRLGVARRKIESAKESSSGAPASVGLMSRSAIDFLEGRADEALAGFRQALKLYKKEIGRRKVFFIGFNGLFFLLALIRANDPALHAEAQGHLDAVEHEGNRFTLGFLAIQALLWLAQGLEGKARAQLAALRVDRTSEPVSAACVRLVELLFDRTLAKAQLRDNEARFDALASTLPLVARIHAEVLARISDDPARYQDFLRAPTDGAPPIAFAETIQARDPWERTLDSLAMFLKTGADRPAAEPAGAQSRRLVWFLDTEDGAVAAFEQSVKGKGWSTGRAVAMKRLYEQDPRLDYLTDHDRRALRTIRKNEVGWYSADEYDFDSYRTPLTLIGHPLVFDARRRDQRLELVAYPVELVAAEHKGGYRFTLSHRATEPTVFFEAETASRWRVVDFAAPLLAVAEMLGETGLTVPRQGRDRVMALIRTQHPALSIRADIADADLPAIDGRPAPVLQIQPLEDGLKVTMVVRPFGAAGPFYLTGLGGRSVLAVIDGVRQRANRDLEAERALAAATLAGLPMLRLEGSSTHEWTIGDTESALEFLLELRSCEPAPSVEWPEGERLSVRPEVSAKNLSLNIVRSRDWFQMDGAVAVDDELVLDMKDLLDRLGKARGRFVPLADGGFLALTKQFQKQLERLGAISEDHGKGRRLPILAGVAAREIADAAGRVRGDKEWKGFVERLSAAGRREPEAPSTLQAELRDYQLEGFRWLSRLAYWQAGACLADDMGLGKTVQAIAAMLEQAPHGPCLVIAPTSVCHNWEKELTRFAPTLAILRLGAAASRAATFAGCKEMTVLVTSYGLLHQEADRLAEIDWRMIVFDEAQAIKNAETRRAQAGQRLRGHFRLALTGTPIENYLEELWSLFAIVNPGLLGSREGFNRRFAGPIERNRDPGALQALRALIRPFVLRRTKSAVLAELPPRTEVTIEIDLPDDERAFYEALRRRALEAIARLGEGGSGGQNRIHILAEITRLRRACCHPGLIDPATTLPGAKLDAFLGLVEELIRNRHKALVFSQFVGQLERVRDALIARGVAFQYLDGSTPAAEREKRVAAFQAGAGDLFLISLRAGGVGLNLTAADYVIHLDPWWNPAVEDQASDRAHRIGQERPVTVYRLIVRDSIEQKILDLHRTKRDLASDLLEGSEVSARLSEDDLLDLIRA